MDPGPLNLHRFPCCRIILPPLIATLILCFRCSHMLWKVLAQKVMIPRKTCIKLRCMSCCFASLIQKAGLFLWYGVTHAIQWTMRHTVFTASTDDKRVFIRSLWTDALEAIYVVDTLCIIETRRDAVGRDALVYIWKHRHHRLYVLSDIASPSDSAQTENNIFSQNGLKICHHGLKITLTLLASLQIPWQPDRMIIPFNHNF